MVFFLYALGYAWKGYTPQDKSLIVANKHSKPKAEIEATKSTKEKKVTTEKAITEEKEMTSNIQKSQTISPFSEEDMDDTKLALKPLDGVKPISAIRLEQGLIKQSKVGDMILLPTIDGTSYELQVTHRTVSNNGNVSINGVFEENGITYHSIITEGTSTALLSFNAPTGSYEVALENGLGYMYLSKDIENERIDYSKSDMIEHREIHQEENSS